MKIIQISASENGGRPALQDWNGSTPPAGYVFCPDELAETFYSTTPAGFVNITVEGDTVTDMIVNQEALDAYIAELPEDAEPEPTQLDRVEAQATYTAMMTDTLLEV